MRHGDGRVHTVRTEPQRAQASPTVWNEPVTSTCRLRRARCCCAASSAPVKSGSTSAFVAADRAQHLDGSQRRSAGAVGGVGQQHVSPRPCSGASMSAQSLSPSTPDHRDQRPRQARPVQRATALPRLPRCAPRRTSRSRRPHARPAAVPASDVAPPPSRLASRRRAASVQRIQRAHGQRGVQRLVHARQRRVQRAGRPSACPAS
jgi:hypothetical protein